MKILITGSEGTIGKPLCKELELRGHDVFRTDLQHAPYEEPKYIRADVSEYRQLESVFIRTQPDIVYHLAAEFGRLNGENYYEEVWKTNAIGTRNVLELCNFWESKLVFASSSEIYGETDKELEESLSDKTPLWQPNEYALSKWVNEVQIINHAKRYGTQAIRCRFFNAYGPGESYHPYRSVVSLFCHRALNNIPYDVYEGYERTFMYIDDFIPTLANVCVRGQVGEVYNIGGADFRSVEELSDIVLEATGKDDSLVNYLPEDKHNVASKKPDISKAIIDLGHDPWITLEKGVPKTIEWMKNASKS